MSTATAFMAVADARAALARLKSAGEDALFVTLTRDLLRMRLDADGLREHRIYSAGTGLDVVQQGKRRHLHVQALGPHAVDELVGIARGEGPGLSLPLTEQLDAATLDAAAIAALARAMDDIHDELTSSAGDSGLVPHVTADATREVVAVVAGDGTAGFDDRLRLELRIGVGARRGTATARALRIVTAQSPSLLVKGQRHLHAARAAGAAALERLDGVPAPEGPMPVILAAGSPAALLHEVCGHGLEVDVAHAARSAYPPPLGRRVAAPDITIVDDPAIPAGAALYGMDDEGHPASRTVLVEQGRLVHYLVDRAGAARTGLSLTGHGRRLDYRYPALARMSCTYLEPGPAPPEAAIAGVRRGLYVRSLGTGETDMSGGEFSVVATESHLVEDGRLTAPVTRARLSGTGSQVLGAIDIVCDDLAFLPYGFQCGKLSQFPLVVSVGQPTIRVRQLHVGPA